MHFRREALELVSSKDHLTLSGLIQLIAKLASLTPELRAIFPDVIPMKDLRLVAGPPVNIFTGPEWLFFILQCQRYWNFVFNFCFIFRSNRYCIFRAN